MAIQCKSLIFYWCISIRLVFVAYAGNLGLAFPSHETITFHKDAYLQGRVIQLTTNESTGNLIKGGYGCATFNKSIPLWDKSSQALANFTTHFQFIISKVSNTSAGDGITFFLVPLDFEPPASASGQWLGLFNQATNRNSSTQVVAVEFDTYQNYFDPDDNHVGIDVNSIFSEETASLNASHTLQNETLKNGEYWDAWVDYDGGNQRLKVFLLSNPSGDETGISKPESPILSYNIDLRNFLPENIKVGLSASTGLSYETHTVYAWKISAEYSWKIKIPASYGSSGNKINVTSVKVILISVCVVVVCSFL